MWLPPPLPRTFAACVRDLESETERVRVGAVTDVVPYALRDAATRDHALDVLRKALSDKSARVRAAACIAAADAGAEDVGDSVIACVDDDDDSVRQMALTALGELKYAPADERIRRALKDRRAAMRYQGIIAFSRIARDEPLLFALLDATTDEDDDVRYIALRLVEETYLVTSGSAALPSKSRGPVPSARDPLEDVPARLVVRAAALLKDDEKRIAVAAAIVLAKARDERGKQLVLDVVSSKIKVDVEDEREAVELAGDLGFREALPALRSRAYGFFRHFSDTCEFGARIALARMGDARAIADITRDLDSSSTRRREAAVVAAGRARLKSLHGRISSLADLPSPLRDEALQKLEGEK